MSKRFLTITLQARLEECLARGGKRVQGQVLSGRSAELRALELAR